MVNKIVTIVGARPQFVKAAVVSAQLARSGLAEIIVHTGQHYDRNLSDIFFESLNIPAPRYNLGIGGGSHASMTGRQMIAIEECLLAEKPDIVLVYGDTNSTLAGALAAVKLHLPVAHVEAGLRSFNMRMPEEVNRVLTDRVAELLFVPSITAAGHLLAEGVAQERIINVGDVMFDAALQFGPKRSLSPALSEHRRVVATIHRAENTDDEVRVRAIFMTLCELSRQGWQVIVPLHPRTIAALDRIGLLQEVSAALDLISPLGYIEMLATVGSATVVVTDSGGLQKEAYFLGVPCVTLRDETEWVETIEMGWNELADARDMTEMLAKICSAHCPEGTSAQPYGDGRASEKIAAFLATY